MAGSNSAVLNEKRDIDTIADVLLQLSKKKQCSSSDILPIIRNVVPIYPSLPSNLKLLMRKLCSSNYIFVSLVIEYAKELGKNREVLLFHKFLIDVLKHEKDCLYNYLSDCTRSDFQFIKVMLFGSKLYNALSGALSIVEYLEFMQMQWEFVFRETKQYEKQHFEMFLSCLQLNIPYGIDSFIEGIVTRNEFAWNAFIKMVSKGTIVQQRRLFNNHLVPFFNKVTCLNNTDVIYTLLAGLPFDVPVIAGSFRWDNVYLKLFYLRALSEAKRVQLFRELLPIFEQIDLFVDDVLSEMLVLILDSISTDSKQELSHDAVSLNFVTKRLHSEDSLVRERTMFIAKKLTNNQLEYQSEFTIEYPHVEMKRLPKLELPIRRETSTALKVSSTGEELAPKFNFISLQDSDNESDDDDPRDILFLKDLMFEFQEVIKNDGSELKLLKETVKLVRQKKDFPAEVSFYSKELLKTIASISNNFDEPSFEEWKANALVSILVVCPEKVENLYQILFNNELSLQQRMVILTSAALAARELRGMDDEFVIKPQYDFPTNRLPWDKPLTNTQPTNKIQDISGITETQVTWKSKRMEIDNKRKQQQNNFRKFAPRFFYPLAHAWLNGINLGTFDRLFKTHFVSMLKIILTCASPHYELEEMQALMQEVLSDATNQNIPVN
ncbi:unnamed protein product [Kluyveromyces dobzhanskii CBS 2104]|uniref:WGS project CCBQ000000000 data, contig 00102 n=1 Tax=Kluyveromyces dobzhanskii CBS 2104 TaxID=1427455 RepID=A0A0A8L4W2_9SACH|nr:unnamed protein product [Kluyveromyces dobzhanskii CBS 2104]